MVNDLDMYESLIPGTDREMYTWIGGQSLIQYWRIGGWEIHYCIVITKVPAILEFRENGESSILLLALNGKLKAQDFITGMHELEMSDGLLLQLPNVQGYITSLPESPSSRLLLITHKESSTENHNGSFKKEVQQFRITMRMFELADKILYANYTEIRPFHYEQFCSLFQVIKEMPFQPSSQPHFNTESISALHEVKSYIDDHLDKVHRLDQLARKAQMNERKFNLGFKSLFGSTLFVYLKEQRLLQAHDRILTTRLPLKQISKSAGYKNYSNFSTAFISRFGYGPASLRKS